MTKTPISQVLVRVSLCWPPMSICGKNVDTLRACKRSNRDFFPYIYRKYLILSYPVYYAGSPKVPPRVFGPLGPKTLRGQSKTKWKHDREHFDQILLKRPMTVSFRKIKELVIVITKAAPAFFYFC